jgi:hypothetical protein
MYSIYERSLIKTICGAHYSLHIIPYSFPSPTSTFHPHKLDVAHGPNINYKFVALLIWKPQASYDDDRYTMHHNWGKPIKLHWLFIQVKLFCLCSFTCPTWNMKLENEKVAT